MQSGLNLAIIDFSHPTTNHISRMHDADTWPSFFSFLLRVENRIQSLLNVLIRGELGRKDMSNDPLLIDDIRNPPGNQAESFGDAEFLS